MCCDCLAELSARQRCDLHKSEDKKDSVDIPISNVEIGGILIWTDKYTVLEIQQTWVQCLEHFTIIYNSNQTSWHHCNPPCNFITSTSHRVMWSCDAIRFLHTSHRSITDADDPTHPLKPFVYCLFGSLEGPQSTARQLRVLSFKQLKQMLTLVLIPAVVGNLVESWLNHAHTSATAPRPSLYIG